MLEQYVYDYSIWRQDNPNVSNTAYYTSSRCEAAIDVIDILTNFTKMNEFKNNYSNFKSGKTSLFDINKFNIEGSIVNLQNALNNLASVLKGFNPSLIITEFDVFGWTTGLKLTETLTDKLKANLKASEQAIINLYASAETVETFNSNKDVNQTYTSSGNSYKCFSYSINGETKTYTPSLASASSSCYVKSTDLVITDIELAMHLQKQINYNYKGEIISEIGTKADEDRRCAKADRMYLYYYNTSSTFTTTGGQNGNVCYSYNNSPVQTQEAITNAIEGKEKTFFQKFFAELSRVQSQFEGTFMSQVVASTALYQNLSAENKANGTTNIASLTSETTIDHSQERLPSFKCPFWVGRVPGQEIATWIIIGISVLLDAVLIFIPGGQIIVGAKKAVKGIFTALKFVKVVVTVVAISTAISVMTAQGISMLIMEVDWRNMGSVGQSVNWG